MKGRPSCLLVTLHYWAPPESTYSLQNLPRSAEASFYNTDCDQNLTADPMAVFHLRLESVRRDGGSLSGDRGPWAGQIAFFSSLERQTSPAFID